MEAIIYKCYGILGSEYAPVFSVEPAADVYDVVRVEIPDLFEVEKNETGSILLRPKGHKYFYTLQELLKTCEGKPALEWYDGTKTHFQFLNTL